MTPLRTIDDACVEYFFTPSTTFSGLYTIPTRQSAMNLFPSRSCVLVTAPGAQSS
jgi:hypothetical protein